MVEDICRFCFVAGYLFYPEHAPSLSLREIFTQGIYNIEGFTPAKGQVVLDVGANYGDSSIWWAKKFGAKVVAFEPLNDVFIELGKEIKKEVVARTKLNKL